MKKLLLGALVAGTMVLPLANAEAYHVIKQHKDVAQTETAVTAPAPLRVKEGALTATAEAHTDRKLISKEAPASVRDEQAAAPVKAAPAYKAAPYTLRGGDQIHLMVYGHEDLSNRTGSGYIPYIVRTDGILNLPLIGEVNVFNRTVADVTKEISERLAEYIIDPKVTVNVYKMGTTRVHVFGQVKKQGSFELDKSHKLMDAVGAAGGFTNKAAKRKVYVVREGMQDFCVQVDMMDLLKGGDISQNIELNEGDAVYITSNHKISYKDFASAFSMFLHAEQAVYYKKRVDHM